MKYRHHIKIDNIFLKYSMHILYYMKLPFFFKEYNITLLEVYFEMYTYTSKYVRMI